MPKAFLLTLLLISSCSLLQKEKGTRLHPTAPSLGQWDLVRIEKSQSPTGNVLEQKDKIVLKNGIALESIAFNLRYIDAIKKHPNENQNTFAAFLFKGSPCHSCDNIESLYPVNPKRGGSKTVFIPGDYFAIDHANQSKRLEFQGSVFYGACEDNGSHALYLYKKSYASEKENTFSESLFRVDPFMDSYPSKKLSMNKLKLIQARYKDNGIQCLQIEKQSFVFP